MGPNGIRNRQITCVGCSGCVVATKGHHQCIFAASGFTQDGVEYVPCGTAYHLGCIVVGEPFRSRLAKDKGLSFPKVSIVPNFICEACTVRAMLSRELVQDSKDRALLMLERMRMIDQACAWDIKTLGAYQSHLRRIRQFETDFGVTGLKSLTLLKPPTSEAIALMWIQQHYALQTPRKTHATTGDRVTYGSARTIRSAASQYYTWDMQIAHRRTCRLDTVNSRWRIVSMSLCCVCNWIDHSSPPPPLYLSTCLQCHPNGGAPPF